MHFSTSFGLEKSAEKSAEKSSEMVNLREEINKLVGPRIMTPGPQIERDTPRPQIERDTPRPQIERDTPRPQIERGHDIERIMSSVAQLTSSSFEGLENLTSELHDLQKFLTTEVARVQSEVDNAMAGIKIIMEAIAPLRSLQTSGTAGRRSGPAANISTPSHQAPALTTSAETLKTQPE